MTAVLVFAALIAVSLTVSGVAGRRQAERDARARYRNQVAK